MNPAQLNDEHGAAYQLSPTRHGEQLLKAWMEAAKEGELQRARATRYTEAEAEAEAAFGKWLLPHDAVEGEKVCMWSGPNLVQAEKTGESVRVTIRARQGR